MADEKPGYLITFLKTTAMAGESVQIQTNLPVGATSEDIAKSLEIMAAGVDPRLEELNKRVIENTKKNLENMKKGKE